MKKRLLYTNDLVLVSESPESQKGELETWKGILESKGLRNNIQKTKKLGKEY